MNYIDLFLCIVLLWSFYKGYSSGLIKQITSLAVLFFGIYGANKFSSKTEELIKNYQIINEALTPIISFVLTFIAILLLVTTVATIVNKLVKAAQLSLVNRIFGAVFGTIKMAVILSIILFVINTIDSKLGIIPMTQKEESFFYYDAVNFSNELFNEPKIINPIKNYID